MLVICKENKFCHFYKTCEHSKVHEHNEKCTYKNSRCHDECICSSENIEKHLRREKLEKLKKVKI